MANLTTWAYIQHENRTHITSVRGKYLSHLTSWTKAPREGFEPSVLLQITRFQVWPSTIVASRQRIGQESNLQSSRIFRSIGFTNCSPPIQNPSFLFCVRRMNQHDCGEMDLNHQLWRMKPASYLCSIPQWVWWDLDPTTNRLKVDYSTN